MFIIKTIVSGYDILFAWLILNILRDIPFFFFYKIISQSYLVAIFHKAETVLIGRDIAHGFLLQITWSN